MSKLKWMTLKHPEWKKEEYTQEGRNGKKRRVTKLVCTPGRAYLLHVDKGVPVSRPKPTRNGAKECARRVRQMEKLIPKKNMLVGPQKVVVRERL